MPILDPILEWMRTEPHAALAAALGLYLLLLVLVLWALMRQASVGRGPARTAARTAYTGAELPADGAAAGLRLCLQRIGLVRYDAFATVAGEQSFSLALLDGDGNGIVLTGLYARTDIRVYAKPVVQGASSLALTEEEQAAIAQARTGGPEATVLVGEHGGRGRG